MAQERRTSSANNDAGTSKSEASVANVDASGALNSVNQALGSIRVISGANDQTFDGFSGRTIKSIKKSLKEIMNIPSDAVALVGDAEVNDDFIAAANVTIEFVKEAGVKGF